MQQTINNHQNAPQNCGSYLSLIEKYIPYNEQEKADQKAMLSFIENHPHHLTRDELSGHMTVSLWTVNEDNTMTLMVYHHIYDLQFLHCEMVYSFDTRVPYINLINFLNVFIENNQFFTKFKTPFTWII